MSDFTWVPSYTFTETIEFNTIISKFENGAEQRRPNRTRPIREWKLLFKNKSQAVYEAIIAFYISKKGQYQSFTWTSPNDSKEYTVRFGEDKIVPERNESNLYTFTIMLREVL